MKSLLPVSLFGVLALLPIAAFGINRHTERGYSLSYPDDWKILNPDLKRKFDAEAENLIHQKSKTAHYDFTIYCVTNRKYALSVRVVPGSIPIDQSSAEEYRDTVQKEFGGPGVDLDRAQFGLVRIASYHAICGTWEISLTDDKRLKLHQYQYVLSGKHNTYFVTCTGPENATSSGAQGMSKILLSFKMDD